VALFAAPAEATPDKPNILFLLTDDQRFDLLGCAGHPILKTPNIDGLAKRGVRFKNHFVSMSICAASRASILTGLYERTHKYTFNTPPLVADYCAKSYPRLLKDAGYRTGLIGKFGVTVTEHCH
jgi:arylsulfatase A-like enzyme